MSFRRADLSNSSFEETGPFYVTIICGIWCTSGDKEILLVALVDGRFLAVTPDTLTVQSLAQPNLKDHELPIHDLTLALFELSNTLDLGGALGQVYFDRNGWHKDRDWKNRELVDGQKTKFAESTTSGGVVAILDIEVPDESTQQVLLNVRLHDTTDFSPPNTVLRAMAISKNGKQLAVVHGTFDDVETASIRSGNEVQGIPLRDFRGRTLRKKLPIQSTIEDKLLAPAETF